MITLRDAEKQIPSAKGKLYLLLKKTPFVKQQNLIFEGTKVKNVQKVLSKRSIQNIESAFLYLNEHHKVEGGITNTVTIIKDFDLKYDIKSVVRKATPKTRITPRKTLITQKK